MPRPRSQCAVALLLLVGGGTVCAQQPACLLLRNGNVLEGRVRYVGGHYRVLGEGSELRVPPDEVATVAPSLDAVYSWRRAQLSAPTVDDHVALAAWCLDQELWPQASRELLDARALAPRDARIARLQWRLVHAALAPPPQTAAVPEPAKQEVPADKVDPDLLGPLPEGALEQFTRQIQPMLVNNCTNGGCHQPGGERAFQLNRDLLHGMAGQSSTQANLTAVLAAIKEQQPEESPLLVATRGPHGGRDGPAFTGRHADLQKRLEEWVRLVAVGPAPEPPANAPPAARDRGVVQASHFDLVREQWEADQMLQGAPASAPAAPDARDEFDPAIFNRQHAPAPRTQPQPMGQPPLAPGALPAGAPATAPRGR